MTTGVDHANLWEYARDLYARPGTAETVRFDEISARPYRTHPMINPSGIVACARRPNGAPRTNASA